MPQDIAAKEAQRGQQPIPPQIQQAMQAAQQQNAQLTQALHKAMDELDSKQAELDVEMQKARLDSATKLEMNDRDNQAKILIAETTAIGAGALPDLKSKLAELEQAQQELAELTLHIHGAIAGPVTPPEASEPVQPPQSAPAGPMAGNQAPAQPQDAGSMAGME